MRGCVWDYIMVVSYELLFPPDKAQIEQVHRRIILSYYKLLLFYVTYLAGLVLKYTASYAVKTLLHILILAHSARDQFIDGGKRKWFCVNELIIS